MSKKVKSNKATRRAPAKGDGKTCFTVMPFGGWFDHYYTTVFVPAIEDAGLKPERADDLYGSSAIVNDIWAMTKRAAIVLADLTGKNPNVFYELGLAHAIAKPAVLVTASLDDVPFDLKSLRVIVYDKNDPNWGEDLRKAIAEALSETLKRPAESVLPTFLAGPTISAAPAPKGENLELLQIKQELRSLRNQMSHSPRSRDVAGPPDPSEAKELIRHFVEDDMPPDVIKQILSDQGVPLGWIDAQLRVALAKSPSGKRRRIASPPGSAVSGTIKSTSGTSVAESGGSRV